MASPKGKLSVKDFQKSGGRTAAVAGVASVAALIVLIFNKAFPDSELTDEQAAIAVGGLSALIAFVVDTIRSWMTDTTGDDQKKTE